MINIFKPKVGIKVVPAYFEITKQNKEGEEIKYNLMYKLSDPMNVEQTAEHYENAKKEGNPLPLTSIQTLELLEDIGNSRNNQLKNHVYNLLRNNWIATTSVVEYNPKGQEDKAIHNYKTSDELSEYGNLIGGDDLIKNIDNLNVLELLVGTKDIKRLNKISNSTNNTPMYFWRLNSKPDKSIQSRVRFFAISDGLSLVAIRDLSSEFPAFLVEQIK